jgi:ribosomal protein S8
MPLPFHLCSQIQNGFRGRLARVAVPHTLQNLAILSVLLREGTLCNSYPTVRGKDSKGVIRVRLS